MNRCTNTTVPLRGLGFGLPPMLLSSELPLPYTVHLLYRRLGVDSIDLLQFYWADYSYPGYVDAMLHLMDLKAKGQIKALGVTNFDVPRLQRMVDAGADIATNQVCSIAQLHDLLLALKAPLLSPSDV